MSSLTVFIAWLSDLFQIVAWGHYWSDEGKEEQRDGCSDE